MESRIESLFAQKLWALKRYISSKDRGVVIGALLSFIPVFPACFVGLVISVFNLYFLRKKELDPSHQSLVRASLLAGISFSVGWAILLAYVSPAELIGYVISWIQYSLSELFSLIKGFIPVEAPSAILKTGTHYGE